MSRGLSLGRWVDHADAKAIMEKPVGRDQPCESIPEYEDVTCHMDGAKWRVKKDRDQMVAAMPRRCHDEILVRGPNTG